VSNDHVATPFREILASIIKPVESEAPTRPTGTRDRYRILEGIYEEMVAAGIQIDIAQLDWAIREYENRLRDLHGERQYAYEQYRKAKDADEFRRTEKVR